VIQKIILSHKKSDKRKIPSSSHIWAFPLGRFSHLFPRNTAEETSDPLIGSSPSPLMLSNKLSVAPLKIILITTQWESKLVLVETRSYQHSLNRPAVTHTTQDYSCDNSVVLMAACQDVTNRDLLFLWTIKKLLT